MIKGTNAVNFSSYKRVDYVIPGIVGGVAIVAAPFVLTAVGFGTVGVAVGSIAATIQGPATVAGGVFASCQSAGVIGMAVTTKATIGAAIGTVAGVITRLL